MTLYEAVYTRKSIRNFRKDKVETSILEGMIQFYHEMEPLFPGIETSIELIDTQGSKKAKSRLGGIINVAAPYYLVIYTEDKERADMNAGYMHAADLALSVFKRCWKLLPGYGTSERRNAKRGHAMRHPDGNWISESRYGAESGRCQKGIHGRSLCRQRTSEKICKRISGSGQTGTICI